MVYNQVWLTPDWISARARLTKDPGIPSDYLRRTRTIDEVYALIDKDRLAAAEAAQLKFRVDVEAAISAISEICDVAGARIAAESPVASAKILIDAEVSMTRLLAEAEHRAAQCTNKMENESRERLEAMLTEISRTTSEGLSSAASRSVEAIRRDAQVAIERLKKTGAGAIREIQELATRVDTELDRDAKTAEEKLREFRERPHTTEEAETEAEHARQCVIRAANEETLMLRAATQQSSERINNITDAACALIQDAAREAEKRLAEGVAKALTRLDEMTGTVSLTRPAARNL